MIICIMSIAEKITWQDSNLPYEWIFESDSISSILYIKFDNVKKVFRSKIKVKTTFPMEIIATPCRETEKEIISECKKFMKKYRDIRKLYYFVRGLYYYNTNAFNFRNLNNKMNRALSSSK